MSEPTIEQMNVAIARFENRNFFGKYTVDDYGPHHGLKYPEMKYHSSWDWLMPVVQKIKDHKQSCIRLPFNETPDSVIPYLDAMRPMNMALVKANLEGVYKGAFEFIQWYNKQKEANNE